MRVTKYVLVAAAIVAVFALIAWYLRDSLIQRISNPLLRDYGISVTDVSLDALAGDGASISYLELQHDKGTTVAIEDLTLPLGTTGGTRTYAAKKVSIITSTRTDGELFELARLINQFLSLPDNLDDSTVLVDEFSLPPYPTFRDLRWELTDAGHRLEGAVDSIAMSATITRIDTTSYTIVFSLPGGEAPTPGHSITAELQQGNRGISINGTSPIDLPAWEPLATFAGIVPSEIEIASGKAMLELGVEIPNDATQSQNVTAELTPSSPVQFTYTDATDSTTSIHVESANPVEIAAAFPQLDWSLRLREASLLVSYEEWQSIPLVLSRVSCRSGPTCSMNTRVTMDGAETPLGRVRHIEIESAEKVLFPDTGVRIEVQPGATMAMTEFTSAESGLGEFEARLVSAATVELVDAGWQLTAEAIDADIASLSLSDQISVTVPVFLEKIVASKLDEILSATFDVYMPSTQATLDTWTLALPGLKGSFSLQNTQVAIDSKTVGLQQDGALRAQHDVNTGTGRIDIDGAIVSFGAQRLSQRISPWPKDRDIIAGTIAFGLDAGWTTSGPNQAVTARTSLAAAGLAGFYADTVFTGLSTQLEATYGDTTGFAIQPSSINIGLVDTGLPIENISADYALDANLAGVEIENLRMMAFGGVISADPFSFRTDADRNTLTLKAESIDLGELLSLNEFEAIEVSGRIGAILPVTMEDGAVIISKGALTGEPAGGVIRYLPGGTFNAADASTLDTVRRALSNFEFDTLRSDVDLTETGDLNLQMRLTGRNPDLDGERPVVLNLRVENNIPQMLKSLRAARAVEEVLEKRLSN